MKKVAILIVTVALLLVSCSKPKPEDVVLKFYKAIVNNDLSSAKLVSLPSAKEEIDRLEKIEAFKRNINKGTMEIMEVVIKNPNLQEGDTAIVNYKIVDYKNFLTLILKDKKWMIAMSPSLKQLPILEFESFDFTDKILANHELLWQNYNEMYFLMRNLAFTGDNFSCNASAIPYSKEKNIIYGVDPGVGFSQREFFSTNNQRIKFNGSIKKLGYTDEGAMFFYNLIGLTEENKATVKNPVKKDLAITVNTFGVKCVENSEFEVEIVNIRGQFCGYSLSTLYGSKIDFCNCKFIK